LQPLDPMRDILLCKSNFPGGIPPRPRGSLRSKAFVWVWQDEREGSGCNTLIRRPSGPWTCHGVCPSSLPPPPTKAPIILNLNQNEHLYRPFLCSHLTGKDFVYYLRFLFTVRNSGISRDRELDYTRRIITQLL
jgi:hypothetical protein